MQWAPRIETWLDASRAEAFTDDPIDRRRIVVQYWYPSLPSNETALLAYITEPDTKRPPSPSLWDYPNFW